MSDWNTKIIEEFRANEGKVGGHFEGAPLLILHHKGRRSGRVRENPLAYQSLDGAYAVFGSKAGMPTNPDWYYNVVANPDVEIEVGTTKVPAKAREAKGEERERIWAKQKELMPGFADYEKNTPRQIPVIVLEPVS